MREGARDFRSGQPFNQPSYFDEAVDIHHIFPRSWCEKAKISRSRYDTIINKTPVSYKTNRLIGGSAPSQYLARLPKQGGGSDVDIDGNLRSHLIGVPQLRADDFEAFLATRGEALLSLIEHAMGKSVYRGERSEEPEGETVIEEVEGIEATY
ncbi:MAG TPA: hypothetical protein VLI93_07045 [Acetobacteraceae bacterium]|nr:hypothetical protein [Acetobacteraceae bacterium]